MVSNASDDLPDPLNPVITVKVLRGISTSMFFRLCCRAPCTVMRLSMMVGNSILPPRDDSLALETRESRERFRDSDRDQASKQQRESKRTQQPCYRHAVIAFRLEVDLRQRLLHQHPPVGGLPDRMAHQIRRVPLPG